ncbi:MAG: AAA family ATPase [Bacteroidia bacterium]|nr:AAA family ATPase [Bacteroidia bacterium]
MPDLLVPALSIRNFKSIHRLDLECRRVNVLIGAPDSGKSNLLEAVGLLSWLGAEHAKLQDFVRLDRITQLFFEQETAHSILIDTGHCRAEIGYDAAASRFHIRLAFPQEADGEAVEQPLDIDSRGSGLFPQLSGHLHAYGWYQFSGEVSFISRRPGRLMPPAGSNLPAILLTARQLRQEAAELIAESGLRLLIRQHENLTPLELQQERDGVIISYPYQSLSDTLRRMLFYQLAISSNKQAVLCFEEPEAFAFPPYLKHLAETIATDSDNQYFIATHSPYVLTSLIEKTPQAELNVVLARRAQDRSGSQFTPLDAAQIEYLLDTEHGAFFNLDNLPEAAQA